MPHPTTLVTLTYGDRFNYLHTLISRSLHSPQIERVIVVSNASVAPLQALSDQWPDQVQIIWLPVNRPTVMRSASRRRLKPVPSTSG